MAKPKLSYAILCDTAFTSEGNKLNLIGIFAGVGNPGSLGVGKFPFVYHRLTLAAALSTTAKEMPVEVTFRAEDGTDVVPPFNGTFQIEQPKAREAAYINFNLNFDSFQLPKAGKYFITVESGDDELAEIEFTAQQVEQQPQQQA